MPTYTYKLPKLLQFSKSMSVTDEQGVVACFIKKRDSHPLIRLANLILENSLPSSYEVMNREGQLLYTLRPLFLKRQHELTLHQINQQIMIKSRVVQLLETSYYFNIDDLAFRFEMDFTSTANLYCNEKKIASAATDDAQNVTLKLTNTDDELLPAFIAILYHSLFVWKK